MQKNLAVIEQIQLPDVRRPAKLTALPEWLQARCNGLEANPIPGPDGRHRVVPTLPASSIPTAEEREVIESHRGELTVTLAMTPYDSDAYAGKSLQAVKKMLMVLPSRQAGQLTEEAKGEAYMMALDDVPYWAVEEAVRRWYRSEYGSKHDYRWQPGPAVLRDLALIETYRVRATIRKLTDLLAAEPARDFSEDHMADMRFRLKEAVAGSLCQAAE